MFKCKNLLSLFVIFIFFVGCGRKIENKLPGKWVIDNDTEVLTMEFFNDGRVISTYKVGVSIEGTWKAESDSIVAIKLDFWDSGSKGKMWG